MALDSEKLEEIQTVADSFQKIELEKEGPFIELKGEILYVGDRVRIKTNFNKIKESQLCEIVKINKDGSVQIQSVATHEKVTVTLDDLEEV